MIIIINLLILGVVAGVLAGLLGVGGGIIIVPALAWFFLTNPDIPKIHLMHMALGTSLATIIFTSMSSVLAHHRRGAPCWSIAFQLTPGIIVGTALGTALAGYLSNHTLKIVLGVFLFLVAIQLSFGAQPPAHRKVPKWYGTTIVGFVIGQISAIVGIGGGSLIVPFLTWCNIPIRTAVATSAACGLPIAIVGTLGYIAIGWHENITWSTGYVYWPAVFLIVPASLLFAPLGARLAHTIPVNVLKRFFAIFLGVVSIKILLS